MINIALATISGAVIILFLYYLNLFGMPLFDFSSHSYLVSYFLVSCIIMAIKTISGSHAEQANKALAVWRLEGNGLKSFVGNEYQTKKLLSKVLLGFVAVLIAVSAYPLATSESFEVTALVLSVYGLAAVAAFFFKSSTDKSAQRAEKAESCDIIITAKSVIADGKVKHTWNDFANELVSADVVNDGSSDGALSILYRRYGKRVFSVQIPVPSGKRAEATEAASALKAHIRW